MPASKEEEVEGCGMIKKARKLGPKASQLDDDKDNGKSHYSVY